MNKILRIIGSALLLTLVASCSSTPGAKSRTLELFNGKDLSGWKCALAGTNVALQDVWSVRDGVLVCKGTPVGVLYKGPAVTDFRMVVEYRWPEKPGNSGIFSRIGLPARPLPYAIETQLMHGSACDVLGLQGKKIAAGQERFFEVKAHPLAGDISGVKKLADKEKPAGEWNRVEIVANGDRYTVTMNGELINDVSGVDVSAGPVGVQSEGGVIEFRKISLTPQ